MANEDYAPTDDEETVLDVLRTEKRVNPYLLREETGLSKQRIDIALRQLVAAGWIEKRTRALYDFVEDPREN